ncbi:MAG: helix-turn-helix domain-containing protein [Oscillospiraceae bacterium]|nr:helix-turn-helix domain-containing protein [Oscillospiraceae bacterium]
MKYMRIKDLREDSDLSQKKIAEILNIKQTTYSGYEIGRRQISVEALHKLADYYGTSVDYLLYRTDVKEPYPESKKLKLLMELE